MGTMKRSIVIIVAAVVVIAAGLGVWLLWKPEPKGIVVAVSALPDSLNPVLEQNLARYGLAARCGRVRAAEVPVLELDDPGSDARRRISDEIRLAICDDRAEAIVLGCAGMAPLAASLADEHGVPVVEGVSAAVKLADSLYALGLKTSKIGAWAVPRAKARGAAEKFLAAENRP